MTPGCAPYRLPQSVRPAVLVIRMGSLVLVEYDHRSLLRILRIMQIPVMAGIPGHDRHIIDILGYDEEILSDSDIYFMFYECLRNTSFL